MNKPPVVIAGASGFIGHYLARRFSQDGWQLKMIGRNSEIQWGDTEAIRQALEGAELLINLAGRSVSCRYNEANKAEIFASRTETTEELGRALEACQNPPRDWFNASTGTIYRHAEDCPQDEANGELGSGFSVEVAKAWEAALDQSDTPATRKIPLRMSIVMGPNARDLGRRGPGGAGVMRPFQILSRFGLGGRMGKGTQKYSWVHIEDLYRAIIFIHQHPQLQGPINIASPEVVSNAELMRQLRISLKIPFGIPTPAWLLELGAILIRTETELVLKSRWVDPAKLRAAGFKWQYPQLPRALEAIADYGKTARELD
ncbi:TIGR01777 family oxidoreductase [Psychromicrobium lacuslunae]|uniref:NAD-dependent epimerase n=1 Tax=Psychromicrobium lacuslunae TaxID=1618207 RepID=A0A0D4C228_9MICC|nr:TIGR01777 family oxidoreductase [Psychromicrobium lacuslunae]AJT42584.1 NAD-dependent epimerase [Psychromicrobium lacuslunae]